MTDLAPLAFAVHAASICAGKGAEDVTVLRLPAGAEFTLVVIATARSERQAYTLVHEVSGFCKDHDLSSRPIEGEAGWYVIDCHRVVVHALCLPQREYYQLERLWKKAEVIDWQAQLTKLPALAVSERAERRQVKAAADRDAEA